MKPVARVIPLLILLGAPRVAHGQDAPALQALPSRPSLTVADFATDRTGWMPPPHLGTTLAELLTDRLVAGGRYRTVDRGWLQATGGADAASGSFGALLDRAAGAGVDYLVTGSVIRLSLENRSSTGFGLLAIFGGGLVHRHQTESVIGVTIRMIDVRTGEVVASATTESGAVHETHAGGGVVLVGHVPLVGGGGSSASGFQDRLLDQAVQAAISEAAADLLQAASRLTRPASQQR
jgi:curli biogenesis system outer membrane secretion channel CsgG